MARMVSALASAGPQRGEAPHRDAVDHAEHVVVVRPDHPWARRRSPVRPAELAATPLVEREEGSGTRQALHTALTGRLGPGSELAAPALRLTTTTAIRQAVRAGAGPAVLSLLAARRRWRPACWPWSARGTWT
jgi:DNA-binding transcriptional LysR family regulator